MGLKGRSVPQLGELSIFSLTNAVYFDHIIFTFFTLHADKIDGESFLAYTTPMMKLLYSNETKAKVPSTLFKTILKRLPVLGESTHLYEDVELLLTNNATIQKLNKQYRDKDKPTDVLSFSMEDPVHLGQIVISVERAREQAKEIGQSLEDELQFLFAHGVLHLLGYDHEKHEEEKVMLAKAYKLLNRVPKN